MLVLKRIPIGILLFSCLFAVPAGAQNDPYAAVERPLQALDSPEANAHVAACDSTCFSLVWAPRAPVIDVTGFGGVGVEGAAAGTLQDPNDGFLKIYVAHGYSFGDTDALRIYNIATDTWSIGPSTGRDLWSEGSGAAVGTKVYSIAGRNAGTQTFPLVIFGRGNEHLESGYGDDDIQGRVWHGGPRRQDPCHRRPSRWCAFERSGACQHTRSTIRALTPGARPHHCRWRSATTTPPWR